MNTSLLRDVIVFPLLIILLGCVSGEPVEPGPKTQAPKVFDHKAAQDTVDWRTVMGEENPPVVSKTDLEWPGEKLGLIGPIVVAGGEGSTPYVLVYDPAGILVGGVTREEVKKNPERLEKLVRLAQERGEIQNLHALQFMTARKIRAQMAAAAERGK